VELVMVYGGIRYPRPLIQWHVNCNSCRTESRNRSVLLLVLPVVRSFVLGRIIRRAEDVE